MTDRPKNNHKKHTDRPATPQNLTLRNAPDTPLIQVWFGNFFEPWLSDHARVAGALDEIQELGFNAVNLDSKAWADFFARYRGEAASPYVAMQEFMMTEAHRRGLGHSFLALYMCGDNLYPALRDDPPVRGEDAIGVDAQSLNTYKYWSPKAQKSMLEHVAGLLRLYDEGHVAFATDGPALPTHTFFDPIVKPSFDEEGRRRYLAWLEKRYDGNLERFNQRYALEVPAFADLTPDDYWLKPRELTPCTCGYPSEEDFQQRTPALWRWIDNQTWLAEETECFFATMREKLRGQTPRLFQFPVLSQWGMFFPPPGTHWWDTATRALDPYRIAPHVDATLFLAAPLNPENDPDASALSVELNIMRNANRDRPWIAGLFMGRHKHGDIYKHISPAEAIGTAAAHGAAGLHIYGYGGADDGGVLQQMDANFKASLRTGNQWARRVLPKISRHRRCRDTAIVFPRAMHLFEPMLLENNRPHRMDLLGWHRQLTDLGSNVDLLHPDQIKAGDANDYRLVVISADTCYDLVPDRELETALADYVATGGTCFHGPDNPLARNAFSIAERPTPFDCIRIENRLLVPQGWTFSAFDESDDGLARYHKRDGIAIGRKAFGKGSVISVGFPYGYSYATKNPACPFGYGREEAHGVSLLEKHPVIEELRGLLPTRPWRGNRDIEVGWFDEAAVVVNHSVTPIDLTPLLTPEAETDWQYNTDGCTLLPHAAVYVSNIRPPDAGRVT